jgi:cytosine/adenosine deaminase-related metal-dependent hydrolase
MIISKVHIIGEEGFKDIEIETGKILSVTSHDPALRPTIILEEDHIAFPGLINSHDHLDFNSFPQLGNGIYNNYKEWADDIHRSNADEINAVLAIPLAVRILWGIYKNLLSGVTSVVNHGNKLRIEKELVTVFQDCYSLHSLEYEKNWKWKLNDPFKKNKPFVIHTGEGTGEPSQNEITELIRANWLKREMIAIHGVAMTAAQAKGFKALVWCPASNDFLLGATAAIEKIKCQTAVLFGTDSTLSAGWNIWDHLRLARKTKQLSDAELLNSLTILAAKTWGLNKGSIIPNKAADIVIAKKKAGLTDMDSFFSINPGDIQLVIHQGNIRLFDNSLLDQLTKAGFNTGGFSEITIGEQAKFIEGDLPGLMNTIKKYYPDALLPFS